MSVSSYLRKGVMLMYYGIAFVVVLLLVLLEWLLVLL
jgi:Na+-transporting methylmalonyl-CoA/oxaloacetate decarboxylase gamma subunit